MYNVFRRKRRPKTSSSTNGLTLASLLAAKKLVTELGMENAQRGLAALAQLQQE